MKKKNKLLFKGVEWEIEDVNKMWKVIDKIGRGYGLSYPEPQIEIITAEQMIENKVNHGLPETYAHWSFGKNVMESIKRYNEGEEGLPYEMIINTDPPIAYLMENNSASMQCLVLAHACCGHADFFTNNYLFQRYTEPDVILHYCRYAKKYIAACEEKFGETFVTDTLDSAHALQWFSVDNYLRSTQNNRGRLEDRALNQVETYSAVNETRHPPKGGRGFDALMELLEARARFEEATMGNIEFPQENLLRFIEEYSPVLEPEQREILKIVRTISQYFFPAMRTKVMNEGWASFWHYTIMTDLFDQGYIDEGAYTEFLHSHTSVLRQPNAPQTGTLDERGYYGINPYTLGFYMWRDIKRICEHPDEEDKRWFPLLAGTDWKEQFLYIRESFIDHNFILQYLSPKVMRELKLFTTEHGEDFADLDDDGDEYSYQLISATHSDVDLKNLRKSLSEQYNFARLFPNIQIVGYDIYGSRELTLKHTPQDGVELEENSVRAVVNKMKFLWPYEITVEVAEGE